jgi:Domain of unknown function (DUF4430)
MPNRRLTALSAACLVCLASALLAGTVSAGTTTANLRVVNSAGTTLADQSQVTGDVTIKTDPNATCFGPPGGSGNDASVPGPSALGIVKDAGLNLSVTDQFGFGLGVCGIGGYSFRQGDSAFWYVKVNHAGLQVGGDQYTLHAGDNVLWYLSPGFPPPNELQLDAPPSARSGEPFTVHVFGYDDAGNRTPIAGALVTGADQPTGADGSTTLELTQTLKMQALHGIDIPSNQAVVACVPTTQSPCGFASRVARHRIVGTNRRDRIRGSTSPDLIRARAGRDHINSRGGFDDVVNCGRGKDTAIVDDSDLTRRCEKVIHKR